MTIASALIITFSCPLRVRYPETLIWPDELPQLINTGQISPRLHGSIISSTRLYNWRDIFRRTKGTIKIINNPTKAFLIRPLIANAFKRTTASDPENKKSNGVGNVVILHNPGIEDLISCNHNGSQ